MSTRTEEIMKGSRWRWWCVAVAGAAIAASGCSRTNLDLTLHGGFGYVVNPDLTVEAGFMKSIADTSCTVTQLGVDLRVDDGQIIDPPNSPPTFLVTNAVITFDGVGTGAVDLTGVTGPQLRTASAMPATPAAVGSMAAAAASGPGGANQPTPRVADDDWRDLFWVPHTRLNYGDKPIDPQWRQNAVTGRAVLGGGLLSAGTPSDGAAVNGIWEFTRTSDNTSYKQAITDRLHYKTSIRGGKIVINITTGSVTKKIVVAPIDKRRTVGLILMGRHVSQAPTIQIGDPLKHFCTFYQLLQVDKRPSPSEQLIPHFLGSGTPYNPSNPTGHPTPGLYCPGDFP
jgi:hypothetical protein